MDGQHHYEINLKKDDLFICLSSDDVYFISKQMDKWFRILLDDSYVPVTLPSSLPKPQAVAPEIAPEPVPVSPPVEAPLPAPAPGAVIPEPTPQPIPAEPPVAPEPIAQTIPVAPAAPPPTIPQPQPAAVEQPVAPAPQPEPVPVIQQAPLEIPPLISTESPATPPAAPPPLPVAAPMATDTSLDSEVQDDFEAVMDSLMKDLEEPDDLNLPELPDMPIAAPAANGKADLNGIASLSDLCDRSRAANSEDYLLLSAYYLTHMENQIQFSLKKINLMLVQSGLTPVNHSVLESALGREYLSMVPDLTGLAEVTEYVLTPEGAQAATGLL